MPLLRIKHDASLRAWDEVSPDFQKIINQWFEDKPDEQPSLFEATTPQEEVEAIAAVSLTNWEQKIKAAYIVRIEWDDLSAVGIQASNVRPGNTGVVTVDFRHQEIPGDRGPILKLLRYIWERAVEGQDRFRWVGSPMQHAAMKRFLDADSRLVIEEAKRSCRRKLDNKIGKRPDLEAKIRNELQSTPPAIPEGRIRLLAGEKWLHRLGTGTSGDAEQDWLSAEQELRHLYKEQLLGYTQPRTPTMPS